MCTHFQDSILENFHCFVKLGNRFLITGVRRRVYTGHSRLEPAHLSWRCLCSNINKWKSVLLLHLCWILRYWLMSVLVWVRQIFAFARSQRLGWYITELQNHLLLTCTCSKNSLHCEWVLRSIKWGNETNLSELGKGDLGPLKSAPVAFLKDS